VGLKHDEIQVTGARSCNQEGDHFWRQRVNTDLLGPSYCGRDDSRQAIQPLSVRWSRRVCKLFNSSCDPTPDSRTSVIAVCRKPVAIRFGLVGVHNVKPKPFVWTKSAEAILAKLDRCPVPSV